MYAFGSPRRSAVAVVGFFFATSALLPAARGDVFRVGPDQTVTIVAAPGAATVQIDYAVDSGTDYEPTFQYGDSSNCAIKQPIDPSTIPTTNIKPYSISVSASSGIVFSDSGTTGYTVITFDCCPFQSQTVCPGPGSSDAHRTFQTQVRDISGLTTAFPAPLTVTTIGIPVVITVDAVPPPHLKLQIQTFTDRPPSPAGTVQKDVVNGAPVGVQVALGTLFSLQLIKEDRDSSGNLRISPVTSVYSVGPATIDPPFVRNFNLFVDSTIVKLSGTVDIAPSLTYAAMHMGHLTGSACCRRESSASRR